MRQHKNKKNIVQEEGMYSKLKIGMSIRIGFNSLVYETLPDHNLHEYFPCPNTWLLVVGIQQNDDSSPILVLKRHPYNIKINELFDDNNVYNKTIYLDNMNKLYWKFEKDTDVHHYATITEDSGISDFQLFPAEPTITDYYEYINRYKQRREHNTITYNNCSNDCKGDKKIWMTLEDSYKEWKMALLQGKLDTYIPTTFHINPADHVG